MEDAAAFAHPGTPQPKKRSRLERESTPSSMDSLTSCPGSLPSDVSFIDEEPSQETLGHSKFYALIVAEQEKYKAKGSNMFRWKDIIDTLKKKHTYFRDKNREVIRSRFRHIKKPLKK